VSANIHRQSHGYATPDTRRQPILGEVGKDIARLKRSRACWCAVATILFLGHMLELFG